MSKQTAPYGTWESVITPELMVASNIGVSQAIVFDGSLYWLESRPQEQGRNVICRRAVMEDQAKKADVLPVGYNCRTRVHEYGGASYLPTCHGVYFVNFEDQQIYCVDQIGQTKKLTDEADTRFADLAFSATRDLIVAVAEVHASDLEEPQNELVAVDPHSGDVTTLHRGHDFYASAKLSPDGAKICWLTWDHPNMPWDGTDLWQAELTDATGSLNSIVHVAGGKTESVFQPEWSPTGALFYVSDRTNWWNI